MFINKQTIKTNQEINPKVHADLIVHNMPSSNRLKGASLNTRATMSLSFSNAQPVKSSNNSKLFGLFIILGGALLIGVLAYLGYKFIISPATKTSSNSKIVIPVESVATKTVPIASPEPPVVASSSIDLSTLVAPVNIAVNTSSTSSSDAITGENFLITTSTPIILDSDNDGLNDDEENVLGTLINGTDSDNDTYSDLVEVNSGYNPAGSGKLKDNQNLATYNNKESSYSLLYPKTWPVKMLNNGATTIFTAPDESLIQITVQDNPSQASILSWYEDSFPGITVSYDKLKNTDTWEGITGDDNLNFYLTDKKRDKIVVISYIPAIEGHIVYPSIFKLLANSLAFK